MWKRRYICKTFHDPFKGNADDSVQGKYPGESLKQDNEY